MIPYGRQEILQEDIDAVVDVLQSDFLTQGPKVELFEKAVSEHVGAGYGVAVNSATSALHIACLALELGRGDILWTTPITFVASANCARYCGAKVDFVDIDPASYNMSVVALEKKLEIAKKVDRLPKIVVPVDLCGQSCDMEAVASLSKKYGFKIVEDASHGIGGRYQDKFIGDCRYADITIFSFHPVKIITTAEGGLLLTNSAVYAERLKLLRSHGITRDSKQMHGESDGPWYYEQILLGYNYRMTELQASLGIAQLRRLDKFVSRRALLAERYDKLLADLPVITPWQHADTASSWHLYVVQLCVDELCVPHKEVFEHMRAAGIGVNLHYVPVHTQPYYSEMGFSLGDFPDAESYYKKAISLPLYPGLSEDDQDKVVTALRTALHLKGGL